MYNSPEERAAIHGLAHNEDVPGVVVGVGSMIPSVIDAARARRAFGLSHPFVVYVGRIDENKGCAELFDYFLRHLESMQRDLDLVLIGTPALPTPAASADPASRLRVGSGQVRRDGRGGGSGDAVVFRESVDGGARSVGAGQAGARERDAATSSSGSASAATRGCITKMPAISRGARSPARRRGTGDSAGTQRTRVFRAPLQLAGHRAEVSRHVRTARVDAVPAVHGTAARLVCQTAPPRCPRPSTCWRLCHLDQRGSISTSSEVTA